MGIKKFKYAFILSIIIHFIAFSLTINEQIIAKKPDQKSHMNLVKIMPLSYLNSEKTIQKITHIQNPKQNKKPELKDHSKKKNKKKVQNPLVVPAKPKDERLIESNVEPFEDDKKDTDSLLSDNLEKTPDDFGSNAAGQDDFNDKTEYRTVVTNIEIIDEIQPKYPYFAEKRGHEGTVLLRIEVLPSGECGEIEIIKSSGYHELDKAAIDAIANSVYKPKTIDGKPVKHYFEKPITFRIEG